MCFPVSTYRQISMEFYDFILGHGLENPGLNRMGLKKDMRNNYLVLKGSRI